MGSLTCNIFLIIAAALFSSNCSAETLQLVPSNLDQVLKGNELVFVNFYADWCRFSQMLKPIFEDAGRKIREAYPENGKVAFAKVDCDRESSICQTYSVSKYPTLKIMRQGAAVKREYRGQRTVDALTDFIKKQLADSVQVVTDLDELELDRKKRNIIGYFEHEKLPEYETFRKVANVLQDDCKFYAAFGEASADERLGGNKVVYKPPGEKKADMGYSGRLAEYNIMLQWSNDKCVPLVREITFENAEELTEEGLPFMILFHHPDDTETPEKYRKQVSIDLVSEKTNINFLLADGLKFTHPLYHLGKTKNDLPLLAIDSFRHMYLWNKDTKNDIEKPGLLREFINDLKSGKLHRDFHNPPPPGGSNTQNDDGAVVLSPGGTTSDGNDTPKYHLDIKQQVITNDQGFRIQILKIEQHEGDVHIDEVKDTMEKIEEKTEKELEQKQTDDDLKSEMTDGGDANDAEKPAVNNAQKSQIHQEQQQKGSDKTDDEKDKTTVMEKQYKVGVHEESDIANRIEQKKQEKKTQPPESLFNRLKPSKDRYTILSRDEL